MSRAWNWDFEDRQSAARMPQPSGLQSSGPEAPGPESSGPQSSGPPPTELAGRARIRRRRAGVALLAAFALVVIVAAITAGHRGSTSATPGRTGARPANTPPVTPPAQPPVDQNKVVASVLAYTPFVRAGGNRGHDIALTFDDGPGPYTPGVLGVLERFHVPATFFAVGKMERYFGAATVREIRDGYVVGDHTETHPAMARLSAHEQHEELFEQIARIELLEGPKPRLFRPPYGSFNATTMRELKALHLLMVLWSVHASDYLQPGVPQIVQRVLAGARPGAIVLMHDGGGNRSQTIAALPTIIRELRA